ncbi:MAG: HDIG domain-containing protein [Bacteroidota bacterium]|nr:HDIG domain-containing protein [Bacteroidota bacterium]
MKNIYDPFVKYSGIILKVLTFAISLIVIVYFFPKEGQFRYEIQQGKPWMHKNLYAPFDFPIYKSREELTRERDSIMNIQIPYFQYDDKVIETCIEKLDNKISSLIDQTYGFDVGISADSLHRLKKSTGLIIGHIVQRIYSIGILPDNESVKLSKNKQKSVIVVRKSIAEEFSYYELFTPLKAIQLINEQIQKNVRDGRFAFLGNTEILDKIVFGDFLAPNLFYNKELSHTRQQAQLEDISLTHGLISEGELIISSGDLVNSKKARILKSFKIEYEDIMGTSSGKWFLYVARTLLALSTLIVLFLFLFNFRQDILKNWNKTIFILLLITIFVSLAGFTSRYGRFSIYLIPFGLLPIIIKTFYDSRLAIFVHVVTIMIIGFVAPNGFEFVFIQFIAGIVGVFTLFHARKRAQLFWTAFIVFMTYSLVYLSFSILHEGSLNKINWTSFIWFAGNGILLLTSYPLIYIFEKMFGLLSDLTLLELSDTNNPLLRKLNEVAPGTFQHSLQVANLAEEVIFQIGGNPQLIRTGALYHDIGKMKSPAYFIENQTPGHNPHDLISFEESADIIIDHVQQGAKLAKKYKLPEQISEFIKSHHGTTKVQYFYRSFLKKYPDEDADISRFSYPGPIPHSRETAVLMMADAVEAASRSLKKYTERSIIDLVDEIIDYQRNEDQFDDAEVTFKDISTIKRIFVEKLKNIYHTRIEYPK